MRRCYRGIDNSFFKRCKLATILLFENSALQHVQGLLQAGANPNIPDATGQTPLQLAKEDPEITALSIDFGADWDII